MKNIFALLSLAFLCFPTFANANSDDSNRCSNSNQACKFRLSETKFKQVKGYKFLNQATRSTQVLAIVGGENDSQARLDRARKMKEEINNSYVVQNQKPVVQNYQVAQAQDSVIETEKPKRKSRLLTQGHYVGLDVVLNRLSYHQSWSFRGVIPYEVKVKPESYDYGGGIGFNYKYAFNYNKFFIAPGLFYERVNTTATPSEKAYDHSESLALAQLRVKDRFGFVANFGYDINHVFSPYAVLGYSIVRYVTEDGETFPGVEETTVLRESTVGSLVYGAGMNIKYDENLSFNLEFNLQKFNAKQDKIPDPIDSNYESRLLAKLKTLKLGIAYNF